MLIAECTYDSTIACFFFKVNHIGKLLPYTVNIMHIAHLWNQNFYLPLLLRIPRPTPVNVCSFFRNCFSTLSFEVSESFKMHIGSPFWCQPLRGYIGGCNFLTWFFKGVIFIEHSAIHFFKLLLLNENNYRWENTYYLITIDCKCN